MKLSQIDRHPPPTLYPRKTTKKSPALLPELKATVQSPPTRFWESQDQKNFE